MTILSAMQLNTMKAEFSLTEKVLPTQPQRRVVSIIVRRYQDNKVPIQHGMDSVDRTIKYTNNIPATK